NDVGRQEYTTNAFTPSIYYDFGNKFGIGARYQNSLVNYNQGGGEDYSENRGTLDLFYNLNRSSAVYLDYQIWQGAYSGQSSNYLSNEISLNASKQFNYFTFTAGAGYYLRQFSDSGYDDISGLTWKLMIDGKSRSEISDDGDTKKPRSFVGLALVHDLNNYGSGNSYYAATRLQLKGGYRFGPKLSAQGMALYQYSDYQLNPSNRADNLYVLSAEVSYEVIRNLTVGLEGGYRNQNSDVAGQSYDDVFIMAKVGYSYNFGHK
ncbi:MAG: outer membrane beta-barrel protein, partial [Desulfobulbaceae bacterium]|nr:outer membrane beta-barrel protein [Desulfobulbaceae bacterium]